MRHFEKKMLINNCMELKELLIKWKETNDKFYIYKIFLVLRDRLELQVKSLLSKVKINSQISDFLVTMYESIIQCCNMQVSAFKTDEIFISHIKQINSFKTRNEIRRILSLANKISNESNIVHDALAFSQVEENNCYEHDELSKMRDNVEKQKFFSILKNNNIPKSAKQTIILKYQGYDDKQIMKLAKVHRSSINRYLKDFKKYFTNKTNQSNK